MLEQWRSGQAAYQVHIGAMNLPHPDPCVGLSRYIAPLKLGQGCCRAMEHIPAEVTVEPMKLPHPDAPVDPILETV